MSPRDLRRHVGLVAVLTFAAAACSGDGKAGVSVEEISTEVAFGAGPGGEVTGPANFNPGPLSPEAARADLELPEQFLPPARDPQTAGPPLEPISAPCPEARIDEFPDRSAGLNVPHEPPELPRQGAYRWKKAGRLRQTREGITADSEVTGFERRLIRNVELIQQDDGAVGTGDTNVGGPGMTFRYEAVQRDLSSGLVVVTTYKVTTNAANAYRDNPVGVGPEEIRAGELERGLVVERIQAFDHQGNRQFNFQPTSGLTLLPLEVLQGEEFQSVALDTTGQQYRIDAKVVGRRRVDACGDIVDGWLVESTFAASGPRATFTRTYDYVVATQYGAVLIWEKIGQEGDDTRALEFTLGQQDPDALPDGEDL